MSDTNVIRQLQNIELMILKDVATICDAHKLKYYLIGGTLLGAVRHKGFIPWDDDIDLVMFRNEYDELFHIMQTEYSDKYFVQRFETDVNYSRYIMKIRLNDTKHVEGRVSNVEMHHGIYIDIFPIDYLKNDGPSTYVRGYLLRLLFAYKNIKHSRESYSGIKKILSYPVSFIVKLIPEGKVNKWFDDICTKDNDSNCTYVTNFGSHFKWKKQMFPVGYFGEGTKLIFEGTLFNAPKEYAKILERLYGNYMIIPPIDKQVAHEIVDIDFGPYTNII